jgi:transcriptional regulator with XRE-family HTH domain
MDIQEQMNYVTRKIREIRQNKRVSQMELSLRSGLAQGFIAEVELGKKQPSVQTLLRIAQALEVNPVDFFPAPEAQSREEVKARITALLACL